MINVEHFYVWGSNSLTHQEIPKIIWMYWDPLKKSSLVDICIEQIKRLHPDYTINIVNQKSLNSFLPEIPPRNQNLPFANYSDVIRLALLEKYGGIWMDASTLATQKLDWVFDLKEQYHTDVIGFYADFITHNKNFPVLETWFLATPKSNNFIKTWYHEFINCYTSDNPKEYYNNLPNNWTEGMDKNLADYLICYLSAIKIMRTDSNFRILMFSAKETAHFYNFGLSLKPHQIAEEFILKKEAMSSLPLIKFERRGREAIDDYINKGLLSEKSLLYRLAPRSCKKYINYQYKIKYIQYILSNLLKKFF